MIRVLLSAVLAAVMVLSAATSTRAAPDAGATVTLSGRLEYVTSPGTPHYELAGYVLLYTDDANLKAMAGQDVIVVGVPFSGPTLYMRPTLQVLTISLKSSKGDQITLPVLPGPTPSEPVQPAEPAQPPAPGSGAVPAFPDPTPTNPPSVTEPLPALPTVPEAPPPAISEPGVVIPVVPSLPPTAPHLPDEISLPVAPEPAPSVPAVPAVPPAPALRPVPLFGTDQYVVFGRLELMDGQPVLVQVQPEGEARVQLSGSELSLAALAGQQVGLVITAEGDAFVYRPVSAISLSGDLGAAIASGRGQIFTAPAQPIQVVLRDRPVVFDQAPVLGNARTLVPLRAIAEALGARVEWNDVEGFATVSLGDRQVVVAPGSSRVVVRQGAGPDRVIFADVTPIVVNGRVMVPVRILAESLGLTVGWDQAAHTVILN